MNTQALHLIYLKGGADLAERSPASTLTERHNAGLEAVAEAQLTFAKFSSINHQRALRWHTDGGLLQWNIAEWTNAAAGEMGEACNAAKKLRRIECGMQQSGGDSGVPTDLVEARRKIAQELGDTATYLDLCATRVGWSLEDCLRLAFNSVSEREGFPERV